MPSHKSQSIFKGAAPVREIRISFSIKILVQAGFEPSHQGVTGGKCSFQKLEYPLHHNRYESGVKLKLITSANHSIH